MTTHTQHPARSAVGDLAGYVRDARSNEDPCDHWVGQELAVCSPCLRDRIAPHFTAAALNAAADALEGGLGVEGTPRDLYTFRLWLRARAALTQAPADASEGASEGASGVVVGEGES